MEAVQQNARLDYQPGDYVNVDIDVDTKFVFKSQSHSPNWAFESLNSLLYRTIRLGFMYMAMFEPKLYDILSAVFAYMFQSLFVADPWSPLKIVLA